MNRAASRPRIGISLDTGGSDEQRKVYELNADYADALLTAGGLPVLLPHTAEEHLQLEMLAGLDGLLIPGGADCDPALYHQPKHPRSKLMDPLRQSFDLALLNLAQQRDLPTLGICLGCQLMNVQRGGTLHQCVAETFPESPVHHSRPAGVDPAAYLSSRHSLMIRPSTRLSAIYERSNVEVNSRHRQAVDQLGSGLIAAAFASDGLLEALEDSALGFWVGVQWHPENLRGSEHERLFRAFVAAAGEFHDRTAKAQRR